MNRLLGVIAVAGITIVPLPLAAATVNVNVGPALSFSPSSVVVAPGDTVTWHFFAFHTTTSDSQAGAEAWASGPQSSGTFSHTFNAVGSYPYYCAIHSTPGGTMMNGVIAVQVPVAIDSVTPAAALPNTNVTISGSGFVSGATVSFRNTNSPSVTFIDANTLRAVVPNITPGASTIVVSNPDSSSASLNGFTVASSMTFTVNSTGDLADTNPGDGICAAGDSSCTLRAASNEANAIGGPITIVLPAGSYTLGSAVSAGSNTTIAGASRDTTAISGTISGKELDDVTWTNTTTAGGFGVYRRAQVPSVFGLNSSAYSSILHAPNHFLFITDSVVDNPSWTMAGTKNVTNSTITGSISVDSQGTAASIVNFTNCTFTGSGTRFVPHISPTSGSSVNYCTIAGGAQIGQSAIQVSNSIISGNGICTATPQFTSHGHNLTDDPSCAGTLNATGDITDTDPKLATLAVNAPGETQTYALQQGSPAIDAAGTCVTEDQRHVGRPQLVRCDIGAFEFCPGGTCGAARRVRADFDFQNTSDIFWHNTQTQQTMVWLFSGGQILATGFSATAAPTWSVAAAGDFDGNGTADLFWRSTGGDLAIWFMSGTTRSSGAFIDAHPSPEWTFEGAGDLDGDGRTDLLWRNANTNELVAWFMNGLTITSAVTLAAPPPQWQLVVVRDFNADGKADIVWRNSNTREVLLWRMNGTSIANTASLAFPPPQWQFIAAGDFNGDGFTDLMWRNMNSTDIAQWLLSDGAIQSAQIIASVPTEWDVAATGDYDDDLSDDLWWRDASTGDNVIWRMNGATITAAPVPSVAAPWRIEGEN